MISIADKKAQGKWILLILLGVVVIGIVLLITLTGNNSKSNTGSNNANNQDTSPQNSESNQDSGTGTQNPETHTMDIQDFEFKTKTLRIKQGDTVIWTNQDTAGHTVTSDSGNELDSSLLSKGQSYTHTFNEKGTYNYHCTPHPFMKATIIVE